MADGSDPAWSLPLAIELDQGMSLKDNLNNSTIIAEDLR